MNPFNVQAPLDAGSNDFRVLKFTAETTHAANAVPPSWCNRYVSIKATGGNVHFGFSTNASAEIDSGVTATAAGAGGKVGDVLPDGLGIETQRRIPACKPGTPLYFVRESDAAGAVVYMALCDSPGL